MRLPESNKFFLVGLSVIVFVALIGLVINDQGLLKYFDTHRKVDSLRTRIVELKKENKRLEGEIDSLRKKEPSKIEEIARKKYEMQRPGEKIYKVEEK